MQTPVPCATAFLRLGAIALAIAACSSDLGGPKEGLSVPVKPALDEPIANQVTIVDSDDGVQYTLDVPNSQIEMSDGRVLVFETPEQLNDAITAFYGTISTDQTAPSLTDAVNTCPHPDSGGCYEPQNRVVPVPNGGLEGPDYRIQLPHRPNRIISVPIGVGRPPALIRFPDLAAKPDPNDTRLRRRHPAKPVRAQLHSLRVYSSATWNFASSMDMDPCNDIATDAAQRKMEYGTQRTSWIKDLWAVAVVEAGNALKKTVPYGSAAATKMAESIVENQTLRLNVNILAWLWNSYNCANRNDVVAGPLYLHGTPTSGDGSGISCDFSHGEISFDGGTTWYGVWIKTCYAAQ